MSEQDFGDIEFGLVLSGGWLAPGDVLTSLGGELVVPEEVSHVTCLGETIWSDGNILGGEVATGGDGGTFLVEGGEETFFLSLGEFVTGTVGVEGDVVWLWGDDDVVEWIVWDDGVVGAKVGVLSALGEVDSAVGGWFTGEVDWVTELVSTLREVTDEELFVDWGVGKSLEVGETASDVVGFSPVEEGEGAFGILSASRVGVVSDEAELSGLVAGGPVLEGLVPVGFRVGLAASGDENELFHDVVGTGLCAVVW